MPLIFGLNPVVVVILAAFAVVGLVWYVCGFIDTRGD
jgi:hypothetical protein